MAPQLVERKLSELITWGFQGLVIAIGTWCAAELSVASKSIQELNIKMAVVLERDQMKSRDIEDLKSRVFILEQKTRK